MDNNKERWIAASNKDLQSEDYFGHDAAFTAAQLGRWHGITRHAKLQHKSSGMDIVAVTGLRGSIREQVVKCWVIYPRLRLFEMHPEEVILVDWYKEDQGFFIRVHGGLSAFNATKVHFVSDGFEIICYEDRVVCRVQQINFSKGYTLDDIMDVSAAARDFMIANVWR